MNMSNTTPAATKVTNHKSWQEVVPFLRTGDVITVYFREGEPERDVRVWVSDRTPLITAGERCLRYSDGVHSEAVTDVAIHSASGRADDLAPLVASLNTGDVIRATFLVPQGFSAESHAITLEGPVEVDQEGDAFFTMEDKDSDTPESYYLAYYGRIARRLRALKVISRADEVVDTDIREVLESLKHGDVVRAVFTESDAKGDDLVITREGPVTLDADRDPFIETDDGKIYHLTLYGIPAYDLSSLEVITPDKDTKEPVDIIEKAARALAADAYATPDAWDVWVTEEGSRNRYRRHARVALQAAGVDLSVLEPLPVHQVRLQPGTGYAWKRLPHGWRCAQLSGHRTDDDVRSWPVMEVVDPACRPAPLTFGAYASRAAETAMYPGAGTFWGLQYATAGLASEAGEVQGKITKMQRDGGYTPESNTYWGGDRDDLVAKLGDVARYLAMACREVGIDPDEVLARNLAVRAARDTIQGSGDNR